MEDPGTLQGIASCFLLGLIGSVMLSLTAHHRDTLGWQVRLFLGSFAIRFVLSLGIYQFGLIDIVKDEDASGWVGGAILLQSWEERGYGPSEVLGEVANVVLDPISAPRSSRHRIIHNGYYYLLASFFYVTGSPYRLVAAALNGFFGALTAIMAYRIGRSLFSERVARRVGIWICWLPSMVTWSAMTIKEPVVILMELTALYSCIRLQKNRFSILHLIACGLAVVCLVPFRFYASYIVGVAAVFSLLTPSLANRRYRAFSIIGAILIVPVLVVVGANFALRTMKEARFDEKRIAAFRGAVSRGGARSGAGSGVEVDADVSTTSGLAVAVAVGGAHLLLAPFPWQLGGASLRMLLTFPELVYWWYLFFVGIVPGTLWVVRHRLNETWVVFLFLGTLGLLYSAMFGNVGLVFRQRSQLLPFLLIFAAVGIENRASKRPRAGRLATPSSGLLRPGSPVF